MFAYEITHDLASILATPIIAMKAKVLFQRTWDEIISTSEAISSCFHAGSDKCRYDLQRCIVDEISQFRQHELAPFATGAAEQFM